MAVLAYFSYGISVFSLKNCGYGKNCYDIGNLAVHGICNFGLKNAVIDRICLRYYDIEYPPMPPSNRTCNAQTLCRSGCKPGARVLIPHGYLPPGKGKN